MVLKLKLAVVLFEIGRGLDVIEVSGAVLSTVTFPVDQAEFDEGSTALAAIAAGPSGSEAEFQSKL